MKKTVFGLIAVLLIGYLAYSDYTSKYYIEGTTAGIDTAVGAMLGAEINTQEITIVDNKLYFVFTMGSFVGSGELKRGFNQKYSFKFAGHGTNDIRERIVETNKGQYLLTSGQNEQNIGKIKGFIDGDQYEVNIPEGEYYLVLTPVKRTDENFVTGMIVYDRHHKEIYRRNVAKSIS